MPRCEAAVEAAAQRLRPILMTSFAFILGVVPLLIGEGAGAEMRKALGTVVFSGMLGVTVFGIFFTPVFYVVIERFRRSPARPAAGHEGPAAGAAPGGRESVPRASGAREVTPASPGAAPGALLLCEEPLK